MPENGRETERIERIKDYVRRGLRKRGPKPACWLPITSDKTAWKFWAFSSRREKNVERRDLYTGWIIGIDIIGILETVKYCSIFFFFSPEYQTRRENGKLTKIDLSGFPGPVVFMHKNLINLTSSSSSYIFSD